MAPANSPSAPLSARIRAVTERVPARRPIIAPGAILSPGDAAWTAWVERDHLDHAATMLRAPIMGRN